MHVFFPSSTKFKQSAVLQQAPGSRHRGDPTGTREESGKRPDTCAEPKWAYLSKETGILAGIYFINGFLKFVFLYLSGSRLPKVHKCLGSGRQSFASGFTTLSQHRSTRRSFHSLLSYFCSVSCTCEFCYQKSCCCCCCC